MPLCYAWELFRNHSILRFDVILQHDWPIEQCLLHIRVFSGGKTKNACFDLFAHWLIKNNNKQLSKTVFQFTKKLYTVFDFKILLFVRMEEFLTERQRADWLNYQAANSVFFSCRASSPRSPLFLWRWHIMMLDWRGTPPVSGWKISQHLPVKYVWGNLKITQALMRIFM